MGGDGKIRNRLRRAVADAALSLAVLGACAAPASAAEADWMYDPNAVVEIEFDGLSEAEIDALEAEPDEYQAGSFELKVDGVRRGPVLGEVGIRLKGGNGSFRPLTEKAGFKVKFDEYVDDQVYFGLEKLTLNNMVQDPSMSHEVLTYELIEAMGLPGPRTGYALVRLNGELYGVYLNLETLDKIWLPGWFATTQHLYEADTPGVDVYLGGATDFEVDRGKEDDLSDLEALIAAANSNVGDWSDGMAAVADLQQMTREWAVERYVGHWDGYAGEADAFRPNNYYLHSDASGIFSMLPWGADQTWEEYVEFDEPAGGILFNRCYEDTSCKALYVEALEDVYELISAGELAFADKLTARAEMLRSCQQLEDEDRREYDAEEISEGVEDTLELIGDRPEELGVWLDGSYEPAQEAEFGALEAACEQSVEPRPEPLVLGPPAPPSAPPPTLIVGDTRLVGNALRTRVTTPGAGIITQRGTIGRGGDRVGVCASRVEVERARRVTVHCSLSKAARERRRSSSPKVAVTLRFRSVAGSVEGARDAVRLPRCSRGFQYC